MDEKFKFEKLNADITLCVSKEHRFGTDAVLLADFARVRQKELVCDLGTGCGIIPFLLTKIGCPRKIYGVDIQPQAIEQFQLGVAQSNLVNEVIPLLADLKQLTGMEFGQFDLVTCNPPYKAGNTGILSELDAEQIARHEVLCTIDDICRTAAKLLRFGGRLCLCQRPERLADVITAMRGSGIEPKRLQLVAKNAKSAPWLFLIEGKRSAKPFLQVLPTLCVYENDQTKENSYTPEMQKIYDRYMTSEVGADEG